MNIGDYIRSYIKERKISIRWLADQMKKNEKTLANNLRLNTLSTDDLISIVRITGMSVDSMIHEFYESKVS